MQEREQWTSRLGFIMAGVGMAVGTGNMWRFPRVAGINGGGSFLIAYLIANITWVVPLIITELAIGKQTKLGTVGTFKIFAGEKRTWQGLWIGFVCAAITFYYVIVLAWALRYLVYALNGTLRRVQDTEQLWETFIHNPKEAVIFQMIALIPVGFILFRGVNKGIEKAGKYLIPLLFLCLLYCVFSVLSKPGASVGLRYLFMPSWSNLKLPSIWLNAYTQAAWSSGAGWGMMLTYANYMKKNEDITLNGFLITGSDIVGAMLSALVVLPAVFAFSASDAAALDALKRGNVGLTFICLTKLFNSIQGGAIVAALFFIALSLSALTSLLPQTEVIVKNFIDFGWSRKKAVCVIMAACFVFGLPSAIDNRIFNNQDWVWGIGLLVCGLFYALAVYRFGIKKFRETCINPTSDFKIGRWYDWCIIIYPFFLCVIIAWWLGQSMQWSKNWWTPVAVDNPGTVLVQCAVSILVCMLLNKYMNKKIKQGSL